MKRKEKENSEYTVHRGWMPAFAGMTRDAGMTPLSLFRVIPAKAGIYFIMLFASLIFLFSFLFVNFVSAEVVTLKKPLTWSAGGGGALELPKPHDGVYALTSFIATDGQITSITANYEAFGKINLEVSADNGLHYYAVTNGVPLKRGFVKGNRLRWQAKALSDDAKLTLVKIKYTDSSGVIGDFGEPSLSGFLYRKEIKIKNTSGEGLYNYQLKLKIGEGNDGNTSSLRGASVASDEAISVNCEGHILADFKDIRFTAADRYTPLPYYRESVEGEQGSRMATFWVKVPQIPKEGVSLYLYYGNAEAEDLSDPNATFDFYENFTGASLDKNKWVLHTEQNGSATLTDDGIKLDAAKIISKAFRFKEGIIEYACKLESGFENSLDILTKNVASFETPIYLAYSSIYKGAEHCIAPNGIVKANDSAAKPTVTGEKYNYRLTLDKGKMTFERFAENRGVSPSGASPQGQASATYQFDPAPSSGYLSLRSGGDGNGKNIMHFGVIRVRKSAETLPVVEGTGKEESVSLPVFSGTKVSASGELVLKDDATSGYYLSTELAASSQPTRILIPSWKVENAFSVSVSISADNGATYKKNCENEKYYYASKKDFAPGTNLKIRLDLAKNQQGVSPSGASPSGASPMVFSEFSLDYRPGKITLVSPNGGEALVAGSPADIVWLATEYEPTYPFNLAYSADSGKNYTLIAQEATNSGEYIWQPVAAGEKLLIKLSDANAPSVFDTSDKTFSAQAAEESSDYIARGGGKWSDTGSWAGGKVPGLASEVKISVNGTLYADEPISFRTLAIGDGEGKNTTTLVLKAGVNKGCQEIVIRKGGRLIQDGENQISLFGSLTVGPGAVLTHAGSSKVDILAKNINIEPGAKVEASGLNNHNGGLIKLSALGDFYIYSSIIADGKDELGGAGGQINLSADKFGGTGAVIHAQGGFAEAQGGEGGKIDVIGKGGAISGTINVNGGEGKVEGKAGSIVFR